MLLKDQLLTVADAFANAKSIGRQRVSTIVLNRGATLDAIALGRADVTTGTFEKAMLWFSTHWPEGTDWPEGVVRPNPPHDVDRVATAGPDGGPSDSGPALSREAAE